MYEDRKYTDRDIRDNPKLISLAEGYLLDYTGEFDYLLGCRELVEGGERLPIPLARGVLNCMRLDPKGFQVLQDYVEDFTDAHGKTWREARNFTAPEPLGPTPAQATIVRAPRLQIVRSRPAYVPLKTRWKKTYVLSTWQRAKVAHLIKQTSRIVWMPYTGKYVWDLKVWCGAGLREAHAFMTNDTQGREVCRRCTANKELFDA